MGDTSPRFGLGGRTCKYPHPHLNFWFLGGSNLSYLIKIYSYSNSIYFNIFILLQMDLRQDKDIKIDGV